LQAVFSYDQLDVGDTFINALHQYEVELQNRGKIEAHFSLLPSGSTFGSKFQFEPDAGILAPCSVSMQQSLLGMICSDCLVELYQQK
jgi:hydrocephalus-inducing protein